MIARRVAPLLLLAAAGCAGPAPGPRTAAVAVPDGPIEVGIVAINDFHGNLQPPRLAVTVPRPGGGTAAIPAGGAAYLASAVASLRARHPDAITVSAGDLTGASPLASSLFLDEPTVAAMNLIGLDLNAAGNHEFDRGAPELLRLQGGGCARHTAAQPCRLERFGGARFRYLAGNTVTAGGGRLLPGTALRRFGRGARRVTVGFIGLTTRTTGTLISRVNNPGITFADEAATANALAPALLRAGADTIVLLVHEGGYPSPETDPNACEGLSGPIRAIAERLHPAIATVVSGHTHKAYVCDLPRPGGAPPVLLTSAGRYGTLVTDLTLSFDPVTHGLAGRTARNVVVQGEGFTGTGGAPVPLSDAAPRFAPDPAVAAVVARYVAAAQGLAGRVVARVTRAPAPREGGPKSHESELGNLIADAQLAATRAPALGGAQVAFMNPGGIRADLRPAPDGSLTYGDLYAVQPFGNTLTVRRFTGAQLRAVLEQQFDRAGGTLVLSVAGMTYAFDRTRPAGSRVLDPVVAGRPLDDAAIYRVATSDFLANGGDGLTTFAAGAEAGGGPVDLDALTAYLSAGAAVTPPAADRIVDRTPADPKAAPRR